MTDTRWVLVDGGRLRVEVSGIGRPVVVVQTALDEDELRPLCAALVARGGIEVVHAFRRGYAGSGPSLAHASIGADASDVATVIRTMGVGPAQVVGASYSAAVALALAVSDPEVVRSLTIVEPPPSGTPAARDFCATCEQFHRMHATEGAVPALHEFMAMLVGEDWRERSERERPGAVEAMERGAPAFFDGDLASLVAWTANHPDLDRIRCPVLLVGGSETHHWFSQMLDRLRELLPHATSATIDGADHLVASTHPVEVAALADETAVRQADG